MLDISAKIDKLNLEILKKVKKIADEQQIEFYLVGATVRDMILNYVYSIVIYRKTNDIDFAVSLKNWNQYKLLTKEIEKAGFEKNNNIMHRYSYNRMIIDLIPFGNISSGKEIITWPDEEEKEMNVIGFKNVFNNTEELLIQSEPEIIIKTASVEGLVILKIFSWNDRALAVRIKDAIDIYIIITTYLDAGNLERLYNKHSDLVNEDFDYELGGASLLGRDISTIASENVLKSLLKILRNGKLKDLAKDMSLYENIRLEDDQKIDRCIKILQNLLEELSI